MIIGITGTNGAGKGEIVTYLQEKGFTHYSSSDYLATELARRGMQSDRSSMRMIGNEFRQKFGHGYLIETFLKQAKADGIETFVIESLRNTGEVERLHKAGGVLLVVDADRKERYKRIFSRKSTKDFVDFDTFVEQEEREWYGAVGPHDMNIKAVMEQGDYTITNNGTLAELHAQVDAALETLDI